MDHGDVLFSVPVVPERDDPKSPETARQVGHSIHLDTNVVDPKTSTVMVFITFHQILKGGDPRYS
jgi:hypothetical protein